MQEQLQHDRHAQTTHTPHAGQSYRVKLSAELLKPLCHALGHAIYRLAMTASQESSIQSTGRQTLSQGVHAQNKLAPTVAAASGTHPLLELVTGRSCSAALFGTLWLLCFLLQGEQQEAVIIPIDLVGRQLCS